MEYTRDLIGYRPDGYVLIDLDAVGRIAADHFHAKGVKHLIFSAMAEGNYRGPFSSMQVQVMKGM